MPLYGTITCPSLVELRTRVPWWPSRHACADCARTNPRVMGPRDSKFHNGCMRSGKKGPFGDGPWVQRLQFQQGQLGKTCLFSIMHAYIDCQVSKVSADPDAACLGRMSSSNDVRRRWPKRRQNETKLKWVGTRRRTWSKSLSGTRFLLGWIIFRCFIFGKPHIHAWIRLISTICEIPISLYFIS